MEQLLLFNSSTDADYNVRTKWVPMFAPETMDALAGLGAMNWRNEIERRNFELRYKKSITNHTNGRKTPPLN